jgi:ATP-binding protein involved in chromosome partitioning
LSDSNLTPDSVREALRGVLVPGTKVDVVKIDLIGDIAVDDGNVVVQVKHTTEKPETIEAVVQAVGQKLLGLPGVAGASVDVLEMQPQKPAAKAAPDPWADRKSLPGVKKIVAVASGKGGVGKSTVAVNLALALQAAGHRVGLLDADIYGPSLPTMLGSDEGPEALDGQRIRPVTIQGLQCISMGMLVPAGQAVVWRGPMVMAAVRQFLKDVQWDALDYLVVDMPPGTGDAQLTLVQQVPVDGVVMVTTPQELALADVRRGIQMFGQVGTSVLGVVENMSYFHCPDNGKDYYIFGQGGGAAVAKEFGVPLLAEIPLDPATREGGDTGRPVVERGDSPTRTAFLELAGRVDASVNP